MENRLSITRPVYWQRCFRGPLMVLLMTAVVGCGSSGSDDPGNSANDDQVPSAKGPYNRIKRSAPRQAAVRMQHLNYLKQIGLAMHTFHSVHAQLPIGESPREDYPIKYGNGNPLLSWRVYLLPYLEAEPLYKKFKLDEPWDSPHNIQLLDQMPDQYKSLDYQGLGNKTVVLGLSGPGGIFDHQATIGAPGRSVRFRDIADGTANTLLVIMAGPDKAAPWTQPVDLHYDMVNIAQSLGAVGESFLALFADGSARRIRTGTDPKTLVQLFQYRDGQQIDFDKLSP